MKNYDVGASSVRSPGVSGVSTFRAPLRVKIASAPSPSTSTTIISPAQPLTLTHRFGVQAPHNSLNERERVPFKKLRASKTEPSSSSITPFVKSGVISALATIGMASRTKGSIAVAA